MKKITSALLASLFLFTACNIPKQYLKNEQPIAAFQSCSTRINQGTFSKKHVSVFAKAFHQINLNYIKKIEQLRQRTNSSRWLDIYGHLKAIESQQAIALKYEKTLNERGFFPKLSYYPTQSVLQTTKDSIAAYYYTQAIKHLPEAREKNRASARNAYQDLLYASNYNPNYLDIQSLIREMEVIGSTNILIDSTLQKTDHPATEEFLPLFLEGQDYPFRKGWVLYHLDRNAVEHFDFIIDLTFGSTPISENESQITYCSNSKAVFDRTEEVCVWDSEKEEYVIECESVYKDVSVIVHKTTQSKTAKVKVFLDLFNNKQNIRAHSFTLDHTEEWVNVYSNYFEGDPEALGGVCNLQGKEKPFPSRLEMLSFAFKKVKLNLFEKLNNKIERLETEFAFSK